jgi:hypothetical protein
VSKIYWDSPECLSLFCPNNNSPAIQTLQNRIKDLKTAQQYDQWRLVIYGHDPDNLCSDYDKVVIRNETVGVHAG